MVTKNWLLILTLFLIGQSSATFAKETLASASSEPKPIAVEEIISDKKIQQRLNDILQAVGTYDQVKVRVLSEVVILSGLVDDERQIDLVAKTNTRRTEAASPDVNKSYYDRLLGIIYKKNSRSQAEVMAITRE